MKLQMTPATNQRVEDHVLARLPFVSPPGQRIEDDVLVKLRGLGGPGSGNFGHAGRPGQVGGSISSKTALGKELSEKKWWHGTSAPIASLATIKDPIFVTTDIEAANWYAENRGPAASSRKAGGGALYPFEIDINNPFEIKSYKDAEKLKSILEDVGIKVNLSNSKYGWEWEVPAVRIFSGYEGTNPFDVVYIPTARQALLNAGYDSFYTANDEFMQGEIEALVVLDRSKIRGRFRAAGGPGSGNFGHAGRPGEVGGSAPSGEVLYKTFLDRKLPGFAGDYDPVYYSALYGAHQQMIHESFESRPGEGVETLMAIHKIPEGGRRVPISPIVVGDVGQVFVPPEMRARWNTDPPIAVAHTHPSSAAPSLQDLKMAVGRYDQNQISKTVVFGKDGSWHELTITEPLSADDFKLAARIHDREYNGAQDRAVKKTDAWISNQTGWTNISPRTFETPEGRITFQSSDDPLAQKKFGKDRLMLKHFEHFAQESPEIWKKVSAAVPKLKYRYYRPDKS